MTEIERKALALLNEVARERGSTHDSELLDRGFVEGEALCRAIEQHEAFRQEVSKAITDLTYIQHQYTFARGEVLGHLEKFVLKEPVDPLVEAMADCGVDRFETWADQLRAAIEKRGGKIVWGRGVMLTEWLECGECGDLFQSADLRKAPSPWQDGVDLLGCPCCGNVWGEPMHQICEYEDCEKHATCGCPHPTKRYVWRCFEHQPHKTGEATHD